MPSLFSQLRRGLEDEGCKGSREGENEATSEAWIKFYVAGESVREDRARDEVKREAMTKPAGTMNAKEQFLTCGQRRASGFIGKE